MVRWPLFRQFAQEPADLTATLYTGRENEAPAELFSAARSAPIAGERPIAAQKNLRRSVDLPLITQPPKLRLANTPFEDAERTTQ